MCLRLPQRTQQSGPPPPCRSVGPVCPDGSETGGALRDRRLMRKDPQGRLRGRHRPIDHHLRIASRQRRPTVKGDLCQPPRPGGQRLQRGRQLQVQPPPPVSVDRRGRGLPQQRVHKSTGGMLRGPTPQDPGGHRLGDRVGEPAGRQPRHRGKDFLVGLLAGYRRHRHHPPGVDVKPGQPLAHHSTHRRTHRKLTRHRGRFTGGRPAHQLLDEERVAAACPVQPRHLLGGEFGISQRCCLRRDRRLVQRPDRDRYPVPIELLEQHRGGRLASRPDRPLGRHHQQRAVGQATTDHGGQRQRHRIGSVHVVQDDQQGPVGGRRSHDSDDRAVQRDPGAVWIQGRRRRHLTGLGKLRDQVDQPGHGRGMEPGRHVGCPSQRSQDLLPEPIGRRRIGIPGPPPHHRPALPGGRHGHLLGQRRLADPRLPNQVHHPRRTTSRRGHRRRDRFQLPRTTHQHRRTVRVLVTAHRDQSYQHDYQLAPRKTHTTSSLCTGP